MFDKRLIYAHAAEIGLAAPLGFAPRERRDLDDMPCRFPVVLKPAERTVENAFTLAKAWRANDRASLLARYDEAAALVGADAIVLQELIPGDGTKQFSYAAVFDRGRPVAELTARRRRQYPIEFGYTSTFVETVDCAEVAQAGRRFLASCNYTGIAEVEFKLDGRDGRYKILDVNARIWSWAALGAAAGVDFAHILWRLACGEPLTPVVASRPAAWMHASRDLTAAGLAMLSGRLTPAAYARSLKSPRVRGLRGRRPPARPRRAAARPVAHADAPATDLRARFLAPDRDDGRVAAVQAVPPTPGPDSPYSLSPLRHKRSPGRAD